MKAFILHLILLTTLIAVNADPATDQANADAAYCSSLIPNTTVAYVQMTEDQIKSNIEQNIAYIESLMNEASVVYRTQFCSLVADQYDIYIAFANQGKDKMWATLATEDIQTRITNEIKWGVTVAIIRCRAERERDRRMLYPLVVTNNAANLTLQLAGLQNQTLNLTQWVVGDLAAKNSTFWSDVHQKIVDFLKGYFVQLNINVAQLIPEPIRALNLQLLINDWKLLLAVADTREMAAPANTTTSGNSTDSGSGSSTAPAGSGTTATTKCPLQNIISNIVGGVENGIKEVEAKASSLLNKIG